MIIIILVNVVIEEFEAATDSQGWKVKEVRTGVQQYRQNGIFEYDQKKLYEELDGDSSGRDTNCMPDAEESCEFWSNIWDNPIEHNRDVE